MTVLEPLPPSASFDALPLGLYVPPGAVTQNPARVYLARLARGGRATQELALGNLAELARTGTITRRPRRAPHLQVPDPAREQARNIDTFPWAALRYQHTQQLRAALGERLPSTATANRHLVALRQTLREAWRLGPLSAEAYQRAADLRDFTGSALPAGRHVIAGEIAALVETAGQLRSPVRERDLALLALFFGSGGRLGELHAVSDSHYDPATGQLKLVRAKRNRQRYVYLSGGAQAAVNTWLPVRGDWHGALLCPVTPHRQVARRPLTQRAIRDRLMWLAEQARVAPWTPHDARRTFITQLLDQGVDVLVVQQLAGHASADTTAKYDRRPEDAKRRAVSRLHFPYASA